ncbi:hypothetical protein MY11210_002170 [Beauveria gryllotalpidicola]
MASTMESLKAALEQFVLDPRFHDLLSLVKTARNGAVYGAKHGLSLSIRNGGKWLTERNSFRQKCQLILRATKKHASNLARFATIYKLVLLALKHYGPTPGKEGPYDSFFAGLVGGYFVFGQRSPRTGKISSVSQQIVIYIFARVCLALAKIAVKPGATPLPWVADEPLRSRINDAAWPVFAALSWGAVMLLFKDHPDELQSSLRSSMTYIYKDCDSWESLRTLIWHNK